MIRKIIKIFIILLIINSFIINKYEFASKTLKLGDLNYDNQIDSSDLLIVLRHIAAKRNNKHPEWILNDNNLKVADVTQNNVIDASDVLMILRYIAANSSQTSISKKHPDWIELENRSIIIEDEPSDTDPIDIEPTNIETNVLFIGNSKTFYNSLAKNFMELSIASGKNVYADDATESSKTLEELIEKDEVKNKIKSKKWDYIVLQEQTNAAIGEYETILNGAKKIIDYAKSNSNKDVKVIYDSVWILNDLNVIDINKSNKNLEEVQKQLGGKIVYTGNAFIECSKQNPQIKLFVDKRHPMPIGTYLRACCDYRAIFDESPEKIKYYKVYDQKNSGKESIISKEDALKIQQISANAYNFDNN